MKLRLSRHAKNNMRLYGITQEHIRKAIESPDKSIVEGERQTVMKAFPKRFSGFPVKVVFVKDNGGILVVTAYPLRAKYWRKRK